MSDVTPAPGTAQTPTKAIVAFIMACMTSFLTAITVGVPDRPLEWIVMIAGVLVTGYATWQVPNQPKRR